MASILKVENISHTNGTAAMTIDDSGRVLQPAKPAIFFQGGSNTNITTNNNDVFGATNSGLPAFITDGTNGSFIQGGITYNSTTGEFAVPVNGLYKFFFQAYLNENATCRVSAYRNSDNVALAHIKTGGETVAVETIVHLTTSDTMSFRHATGADRTIYHGLNHTFGYIHLIG